ncbi:DarT ssDNA thymidine ADP-ribosyltransferase family protein [Hyphomonas sp.]|uniref:DarT ssDNA thymidine ADP-ribosyltransferase family protein n=1 Tax=Hyphomonas sp. TaxID=87 RepID=UPI0039199B84
MAISDAVIEEHIRVHTERLARSRFPYAAKWPEQIFRHEPIQNLAAILNSGQLLSRNAAQGLAAMDVAAAEIVNNNNRAHDFARLYFRPRNPTQYSIEGIRKAQEIRFGAHAPMLGMLVFCARRILSSEGVRFSTCNMQNDEAIVGDTDQFFTTQMDFARIYHNGSFGGDVTIKAKRCAEVLLPSPMEIAPRLLFVLCRSEAEKETLLNLLNPRAKQQWARIINTSDDLTYFEKKFAHVELVYLTERGVVVQFAQREDGRTIDLHLECVNARTGAKLINYQSASFAPIPDGNARRWRFDGRITLGTYRVTIHVENCLAYDAHLEFARDPF